MTPLVTLHGGWAPLIELACLRDSTSDLAWGLGAEETLNGIYNRRRGRWILSIDPRNTSASPFEAQRSVLIMMSTDQLHAFGGNPFSDSALEGLTEVDPRTSLPSGVRFFRERLRLTTW
jgi:hypothetical protein